MTRGTQAIELHTDMKVPEYVYYVTAILTNSKCYIFIALTWPDTYFQMVRRSYEMVESLKLCIQFQKDIYHQNRLCYSIDVFKTNNTCLSTLIISRFDSATTSLSKPHNSRMMMNTSMASCPPI